MTGAEAARQTAYGVANAYRPGGEGKGVLTYRTPIFRYGLILLQVVVWFVVVRALIGLRRRARQLEAMSRTRPALEPEPSRS